MKTPINPLDLPMGDNDANAVTVRDYLQELLLTLIHEQDSFSGKRPFGNSGWFTCDLAPPLIKAGLVQGTLDSDDYTETCNEARLEAVLRQAICEQFKNHVSAPQESTPSA